MTVWCEMYAVRNSLMSLITSYFIRLHMALFGLQSWILDETKIFFYCKPVWKSIKLGITIFKMFNWGGIWLDIWSKITFCGSAYTIYLIAGIFLLF